MIPYFVLFGLLFISQRSLIYPGSISGSNKISKAGFPEGQTHELKLKTEDHLELNGWLVLPKGEKANELQQAIEFTRNNCNLVLFFPGNAENRQLRVGGILDFTQLGFAVLIVDYRGYADNPGSPSQKWMTKDAIALWDLLTQEYQISNEKIFIFGESLGGAVAVQLVSDICQKKTPPACLVINSSFSSLADVASYHYPYFPLRLALLDQWNSKERISQVTCPIIAMHGTADKIVPFQFGKSLFEAAPAESKSGQPKKFHELAFITHNGVPRQIIQNIFRELIHESPSNTE